MHKIKILPSKNSASVLALVTTLVIGGCTTNQTSDQLMVSGTDNVTLQAAIMSSDVANKAEILQGLDQLLARNYRAASSTFNSALLDDPKNSVLNYLNGMTYHLMSEQGYGDKYELAAMGYITAIENDPNCWIAYYQLGRIFMKQKKYGPAQEAFANALLYQPKNLDALYNLAMASYYAHDVKRAFVYITKAVRLAEDNNEIQRSATIIAAAAGEKEAAQRYFDQYKQNAPSEKDIAYVRQRMQDWDKIYASGTLIKAQYEMQAKKLAEAEAKKKAEAKAKAQAWAQAKALKDAQARNAALEKALARAQYGEGLTLTNAEGNFTTNLSSEAPVPAPTPPAGEGAPAGAPASEPAAPPAMPAAPEAAAAPAGPPATPAAAPAVVTPPAEPGIDMVMIDGVVMRVSEDGITSKGNNILQSLTVAFTANKSSEREFIYNKTSAMPVRQLTQGRETIKRNLLANLFTSAQGVNPLTAPITYSLNIASTQRQYFEVIGRPTLAVRVGSEGDFYSGSDRHIPIAGDRGGSIETLKIGISLKVTPVSIEGDIVTLKVHMDGASVLTDPAVADVKNAYLVTANSYVTTEIKAKIGESVVLGGIKLRTENDNKQGFPLLQDIPGLQYLFSNENTRDERRTVLYMLTVRGYGKDIEDIKARLAREASEQVALCELDVQEEGDWFSPESNTLHMLRDLKPLFREFRTADVKPLDYMMHDSPEGMINQFVPFIWY